MRLKKDFTFSDGGTIKVHEVSSADLDLFKRLSEDATKTKYEDAGLFALALGYYPIFAACSDNPPSLEESYKKTPDDLDNWFLLCCQLNQDWMGEIVYKQESIEVDGRSITVKSRRPSVEIRLAQLEQELKQEKPCDIESDQEYKLGSYLPAAAASFGKVPTAYAAKHELGIKDFGLWHGTVRKLIPEWYGDEVAPADEKEKKSDAQKPGES